MHFVSAAPRCIVIGAFMVTAVVWTSPKLAHIYIFRPLRHGGQIRKDTDTQS
jgi:hypothetical protein